MAVTISNRLYKNDFDSSTVNFLCGNTLTWQELSFNVDVSVEIKGTSAETFSFPESNKIVINSGKNWKDFGFEVGRIINFGRTVNDGTTWTYPLDSYNILAINGNVLVHDGSFSLLGSGFTMAPQNLGTTFIENVRFYSFNYLDAVNLKYGIIKNDDINSGSLNSIIDSSETVLTVAGLNSMAVNDVIPLNAIGIKSGMSINHAEIKFISLSGDLVTKRFQVKIQFMIHGLYDTINELNTLTPPNWFALSSSLTDNVDIRFYPQENNPNTFVKNDLSWTAQLGNVGWLNENYNGGQDVFSVENKFYLTGSGIKNSLIFNEDTFISCTINGLTTISPTLKLQYGILWATNDINDFKNNNNEFHKNLKVNTNGDGGFGSSTILVSAGGSSVLKEGFSNDNAKINVSFVDFTVTGTAINLQLTVVCTPEFQQYLIDNPDNRKYLIWVSIGEDDDVNNTNRVTKLIDYQDFQEYVAPDGEYSDIETVFVPHELNSSEDVYCLYQGYVEDEVLAHSEINIDTLDNFVLDKFVFKVEARKISDGSIYALDSYAVNVSNYPTILGVQEIDFETYKNFKVSIGNEEKNLVKISRNTANDSGTKKNYSIYYGFKIRWEDWILRSNVPVDFFDNTQLNNGFNNDWYHYINTSDYVVEYAIYTVGKLNGVSKNYRNGYQLIFEDYNVNENIDHEIKTYKYSDLTVLDAGTDLDTGLPMHGILDSENTLVEIKYVNNLSDWNTQNQYAITCLEVWRGSGQYDLYEISTLYIPRNDSPLKPITGQSKLKLEYTTPNTIKTSCLIDPSYLIGADKYKISGRIGCYIEPCDGLIFTNLECIMTTNDINLIQE
jgi:hypothetical protein